MSCKEYAEPFAKIAESKGLQTVSFDLPEHVERSNENYKCNIWNGISDLKKIYEYVKSKRTNISLFAYSLGAYFSLNAYKDICFNKCLFQSPVLNMEYLIQQMMVWFNVSENQLLRDKEVYTPIDTLSRDYYRFVKNNPIITWNSPTAILYGEKDELQPLDNYAEFR